jgi:enoyl-CoA hydratase/carnithine racemase
MGEAGFELTTADGVARIMLTRPEQHNALGSADIAALCEALTAVDADAGVRVLLLTGAGERSFCSGASLKEFASGAMSGELFSTLTDALAGLEIPTVCALNGDAWGGGAELALCCDYRLGVEGMRLRIPAARIGLCYPVAGLQRYVERLGLDAATRLLVAAEPFDHAGLLAIGFLHRVLPREGLAAAAETLSAELATLAPLPVRAMKRILGQIARGPLDRASADAAVQTCAASADLQEGLLAQREKRSPRFNGS